MRIIFNGKDKEIPDHISTVDDLVREMVKNDRGKLIEVNGRLIRKGERAVSVIREGDRIELIQFMGGG